MRRLVGSRLSTYKMEVSMKNSLVLYYDYADCLTDLNDHDFRCVIMSIIEYDQSGTDPSELSAAAKIAFNFIKKDLDRYFSRCR